MNPPPSAETAPRAPLVRLVLADDHRLVLSALRHLLGVRADVQILAEARDVGELLALPELALADVVLLDLNLPHPASEARSAELPGLKALPRLRQLTRGRIVVLSMHDETAIVLRALHLGASGFVSKSSPGERLFDALDAVQRGDTYLDPALLGVHGEGAAAVVRPEYRVPAPPRTTLPDSPPVLSRQEREVGMLLLAGLSQKAISHRLGISAQTTHTYKRRLREKLGAASDAELLRRLPPALGVADVSAA